MERDHGAVSMKMGFFLCPRATFRDPECVHVLQRSLCAERAVFSFSNDGETEPRDRQVGTPEAEAEDGCSAPYQCRLRSEHLYKKIRGRSRKEGAGN